MLILKHLMSDYLNIKHIYIERIQKRALRFLLNDNESPYELLLSKSGKTLMNIHRLKILCTEIYKTLQNLNPVYERYLSIS